jgi:hypothetical protein
MENDEPLPSPDDTEEQDADRFALELLTGRPDPTVDTATRSYTAASLATAVLETGPQVQIEPGTLALCFGFATGNWPVVNAAMHRIYSAPQPVWREVNRVALRELDFALIPEDAQHYVTAVLGLATS